MSEKQNRAEWISVKAAADAAGQYIETLGQTDMASWTEKQWNNFIATVCTNYVWSMVQLKLETHEAIQKIGSSATTWEDA